MIASPRHSDHPTALRIYWALGVVFALFFAFVITDKTFDFFRPGGETFGMAYNFYFLSLLEGRFDVPMRVIGWEGQYLPDGRAFMYYGIAPALLRAPFAPFIDLQTVPIARLVVWTLAIATGFVYQKTFLFCWRQSRAGALGTQVRGDMVVLPLAAAAIWLCSPIPILAAGASIYHEPIALAALMTAVSIHIAARLLWGGEQTFFRYLIPLAVVAGLTLHARPHVAVALYAGSCWLVLWLALKEWGRPDRTGLAIQQRLTAFVFSKLGAGAVVFFGILFVFGVLLLTLNYVRFGNIFSMTSTATGAHQYGFLYFDLEDADSIRLTASTTFGTFNLRRLIPNFLSHLTSSNELHIWLSAVLKSGFVRHETPLSSFLVLWAPWVAIGLWGTGLKLRTAATLLKDSYPKLIFVLCIALTAVFMSSYATVTHRYKVEIWPLFWVAAVFLIPAVRQFTAGIAVPKARTLAVVMIAGTLLSGVYSLYILRLAAFEFNYPLVIDERKCQEMYGAVKSLTNIPPELCSLSRQK